MHPATAKAIVLFRRAEELGLGNTRPLVLLLLVSEQPGLSTRDYAEQAGLSRTALHRAHNALRHMGLLEATRSTDDKRLCEMVLTEKGRHVAGVLVA